jgi:hypothetical protein
LRAQILQIDPQAARAPERDVSVEVIRAWMSEDANRALLQGITGLDLTRLSIWKQNFTLVPGEMGLCTGLQELDLSNNQLVTLPEGVFRGMIRLHTLNLSKNRLKSLPETAFQGLSALRNLNCRDNQLALLSGGLFQRCLALQILDLGSNQLTSLPQELFHGLTVLQELILFNNLLDSFPGELFAGLSALNSLSLSRNRLSALPGEIFHGLARLQVLELGRNQLSFLPERLFEGLVQLRTLYLCDNQLICLPLRHFVGLSIQELYLDGNPDLMVCYEDLPEYVDRRFMRERVNHSFLFFSMSSQFFSCVSESPFTRCYQLAADGAPSEVVKSSFSKVPDPIKKEVFEWVWRESGHPNPPDVLWGEQHAFDSMQIFCRALKKYVKESFQGMSLEKQSAVYRNFFSLCGSPEGYFRDGPHGLVWEQNDPVKWGRANVHRSFLGLIDAMMRVAGGL